MKSLKHIISLSIILICNSIISYGQEAKQDTLKNRKNNIYGTTGFVPLYAVANIAYERKIAENTDKFLRTYWLKASGGVWGAWAVGGSVFSTGLTALTGSKKSHLEFNIGIVRFYDQKSYEDPYNDQYMGNNSPTKSDYIDYSLAGGIGYRYQAPDKPFIFRAGLSYPESIYLSFGCSF